MEGTLVTHSVDDSYTLNYTYYGNGCENDWGTGSTRACATRYVTTYQDAETQTIGVYYNFQAATSDSGALISIEYANAPDSFCPLGWQLPYGGKGGDYYNKSRSWKYLFDTKYGLTQDLAGGRITRSYPFSYIDSGTYRYTDSSLYNMKKQSRIMSSTISDPIYNYDLLDVNILNYENFSDGKGNANSIRCVHGISNLESSPWHPRSLISIMAFHFLKAHFPSVKIMSNYLKNETKYFIFKELRANFDEAESKYKMENRILMSE